MKDETKPLQNITLYVPLMMFRAHRMMEVAMNVKGIFLRKKSVTRSLLSQTINSPVCKIPERRPCDEKIRHDCHYCDAQTAQKSNQSMNLHVEQNLGVLGNCVES